MGVSALVVLELRHSRALLRVAPAWVAAVEPGGRVPADGSVLRMHDGYLYDLADPPEVVAAALEAADAGDDGR